MFDNQTQLIDPQEILLAMGYKRSDYLYPVPNVVVSFPGFAKELRVPRTGLPYNSTTWLTVWDLAIRKSAVTGDSDSLELAGITAAVLFRHAAYIHFRCAHAFEEKDKVDLKRFSATFLSIIEDLDALIYGQEATANIGRRKLAPRCDHESRHCLVDYYGPAWKLFLDSSLEGLINHKADLELISKHVRVAMARGQRPLPGNSKAANLNSRPELCAFIQASYFKYIDCRVTDLDL